MGHAPQSRERLSPNAKQRRLRFRCKSAAINGELKYVCWKKFSSGEWRSTQEISRVHRMIHWLNSLNDLAVVSVCKRTSRAWRALYRTYLTELGQYKTGTTSRMDGEQRPRVTDRDSGFVSTTAAGLYPAHTGLRSSP